MRGCVAAHEHGKLGEIRLIIRSMSMKHSPECNRMNRDLALGKREELTDAIRNYRKIIKFIDMVLPMIESDEIHVQSEEELDRFVHSVYLDVKQSGGSL